MAGARHTETAAGQAAVLFVAAGLLGLASELVPGASAGHELRTVYLVSLGVGILITRLPWLHWDPRATLVLAPAAAALIVAGRWYDPAGIDTLYGLWFVVLFGWVGGWHAPRTSMLLAPGAAIAYTIPYLPGSPAASPQALGTVAIAIPIGVVLAEVLAAKSSAALRAQEALEAAAVLLERANLTDDLTGVGNRRQANALLDSMQPGDGLVLLDLDHFKQVNDTHGHCEGDRVLMGLGSYLLEAVRDADCVARFGGEEFIVLVRNVGDDLAVVVDRLLTGWRAVAGGVTLSAGAAIHRSGSGPSDTLKRVDDLLYRAKSTGRDKAVVERVGAKVESFTAKGIASRAAG
jgi:diguanylate cyclase (GGDEF)-like protein